jgi:pyruvate dehydrogenase E2 component (dihydrolipoamide acetyltransferase)
MAAVTMPRLSDSMEEGTIVRWLVSAGDEVRVGDELVEIETDKATMAYEAEADGFVSITAQEGATVRVGATIAQIGDVAETTSAGPDEQAASTVAQTSSAAVGTTTRATVGPATRAAVGPATRIKASPVARRLAQALGVALDSLNGSGPTGRIVKRDVEAAARSGAQASAPATTGVNGTRPAKGDSAFLALSSVQMTIARRMAEAKSTMPEFTLTTDVDMEAAVALRQQFADLGDERPPSLGDFVIKACALALREHPRVNASYRGDQIELHGRVNVGVAVAAPEALFVPTVLDADTKTLGQIAAAVRELAQRGRSGSLTPPEMAGATFTVSNLGMFGISHFTAVLNPPQAAILAVGAVEQRVVAHEGAPAVRHRMNMTLTCDHRVLYGADAAAFLASVRANLQQPLRLVL